MRAVADDNRHHRRALLGRVPDLRAHIEALRALVVVHHHRGEAPVRRAAVGLAVVDAVQLACAQGQGHLRPPEGVLLAAAADEAGALPTAAGPLVHAARGEVEEVMDHHLRNRKRLGVRVLGVHERHLLEAEDVAGFRGRRAPVGAQRDVVRVVHVWERVDLRRVQRKKPLLGCGGRRRERQADDCRGHPGRQRLAHLSYLLRRKHPAARECTRERLFAVRLRGAYRLPVGYLPHDDLELGGHPVHPWPGSPRDQVTPARVASNVCPAARRRSASRSPRPVAGVSTPARSGSLSASSPRVSALSPRITDVAP